VAAKPQAKAGLGRPRGTRRPGPAASRAYGPSRHAGHAAMAPQNPGRGSKRIHGELPGPGYRAGASTRRRVPRRPRIPPAPRRSRDTRRKLLPAQAATMPARDLSHAGCAVTLPRIDVFFVIEAGTRHVHVPAVTAHPDRARATRQARNPLMDPGEHASRSRFLIRDRAGQSTGASGAAPADAGIEAARIPPRSPRANAHPERRIRTARSEATNRMLTAGPRHPRTVPDESARHCSRHRPHQAGSPRPPDPAGMAAAPVTDPATTRARRRDVPGGLTHEYGRAA
jgi:putative transposase